MASFGEALKNVEVGSLEEQVLRHYQDCHVDVLLDKWLREVVRKDLRDSIVEAVDTQWIYKMERFCGNDNQRGDLMRFVVTKDKAPIETPEMMILRVAIQFASRFEQDFDDEKPRFLYLDEDLMWRAYHYLIRCECMASFATMKQALIKNQFAACYVSNHGIARESFFRATTIWRMNGGVGHCMDTNPSVKHSIFAANADQFILSFGGDCGKRDGLALFVHVDMFELLELLELKRPLLDRSQKLQRVTIGVLLSDEFVRRVRDNEMWYMFEKRPKEFDGVYCDQYTTAYNQAIKEQHHKPRAIEARVLLQRIWASQRESGNPYLIFIDAMNELRTQCDPVRLSNLCCEIALSNGPEGNEIATCNLASINICSLVRDGRLDLNKLKDIVRVLVRGLTSNVMASIYNDDFPNKRLNIQDAPLGIGVMGLAEALSSLKMEYGSQRSVQFCGYLFKHLYYYALSASVDLAKDTGKSCKLRTTSAHWRLANDRRVALGAPPIIPSELVVDVECVGDDIIDCDSMWQLVECERRNSNLIALMPCSHSSLICNTTPNILPLRSRSVKIFRAGSSIFKTFSNHIGPVGTEISQLEMNRMCEVAQLFTDQSISFTRFIAPGETFEQFQEWFLDAHRSGLKTCVYYTETFEEQTNLLEKTSETTAAVPVARVYV